MISRLLPSDAKLDPENFWLHKFTSSGESAMLFLHSFSSATLDAVKLVFAYLKPMA